MAKRTPGLTDAELAKMEREAIDELHDVALRHVNRLPDRSGWRRPLIKVAAATDRPMKTTPGLKVI